MRKTALSIGLVMLAILAYPTYLIVSHSYIGHEDRRGVPEGEVLAYYTLPGDDTVQAVSITQARQHRHIGFEVDGNFVTYRELRGTVSPCRAGPEDVLYIKWSTHDASLARDKCRTHYTFIPGFVQRSDP